MDPQKSAQDVVRCTLCKTTAAIMNCNVCYTHMCKDCVEKHFSDKSKVHNVVPLEQFLSSLNYPKCEVHPTKQCELHCKHCDVPLCSRCISSEKHSGHKKVDIFDDFERKREVLKTDLQELENSIFPKYQESATIIMTQKGDQRINTQTLKTTLSNYGVRLHKEIDTFIQSMQSELENMDTKLLASLDQQEKGIKQTLSNIKQVIQDLKSLLDTGDVSLVNKYKSKNDEFRKLPPRLKILLPNFQPQEINIDQLMKQFGSLSISSIETEEQSYNLPSPGAESACQDSPLLDAPYIVAEIDTDHDYLYGASCLSDKEIWTRGGNQILKLYNLHGKLMKSVQTKSGNMAYDIAVTRSGNLVYTDYNDRSINLVSDSQIKTIIRLRGWGLKGLCCTLSGDLLVIMNSDDGKQTKVVRYSGSTEKQSIVWKEQGKPRYSSGYNYKYLSENRNLDICVAGRSEGAVVVVSAIGKLRFRYTGPHSSERRSFDPVGITTDSWGKILIADINNQCIHVLDKDGYFLRYIDTCFLQNPCGLCVDSRDNLFVAETGTGKVKKIRYY